MWAACASIDPIDPRPTIPSVFPASSLPANVFFWASIAWFKAAESSRSRFFANSMPSTIPREESNIPQMTSSFTAFAFAPGVLKTTIPFLVASSFGILFVPAPARAMHKRLSSKSSFKRLWLLSNIPSGFSDTSLNLFLRRISRPSSAILLKVLKLNMFTSQGDLIKSEVSLLH